MQDASKLTWGLKDAAITGAWLWGARAIYHGGDTFDLLHDRQGAAGKLSRSTSKLINEALARLRESLADRPLPHDREERRVVETEAIVLHADTRGSHGYLYVTAAPRE